MAFPFHYLLASPPQDIPSIISSSIFIVVAFYFEARKGEHDKIKMIKAIRNPEKVKDERKKQKYPLYLPKYSVRILLMILLVLVLIYNYFGPNVEIISTNTLFDLLLIVILYFVGTLFRAIGFLSQKKKMRKQMEAIPDYKNKSKYEILDIMMEQYPKFQKTTLKSIFSIIIFLSVATGLFMFTFGWDYTVPFWIFEFSVRETLLLLIPVYYGFRD